MIELIASGFQSIKDPVHITLEGLTIIEGESNLGKSALVRLIHAAFSNKQGTYYISTGEAGTFLEWRDGINHLVWEKQGSSVSYLVNGKKLNKPGRGVVPDEVSRVGVCEIRTSDKHKFWPQIQFQGEPPFVISERSPAIAAELLGSSKDLLTVSRALRLVRGDISKGASKLQILEEQSKLISERTRLLEDAYTKSSQVYQVLETSANAQAASQKAQDTLTGLLNCWDRIQKQEAVFTQVQGVSLPDSPDTKKVQDLSNLLDRYTSIQDVLKISENLVSLDLASDQITDRFRKLWGLFQRAQVLSRKLICLKTVTDQGIIPKLDIQVLHQRYQDLQKLQDRHTQLTRSKGIIENNLIDINKKLKALDQESKKLNALVQDLESCPFCEAPIHEGKFCSSATTLKFP